MSDIHAQISVLSINDSSPSESQNAIEPALADPAPALSTNHGEEGNETDSSVESDTNTDETEESNEEPDADPTPAEIPQAQNAELLALQSRLLQLEARLVQLAENDARRDAEIDRIRAENDARLHVLENRISEIHSRVLVMQEGLVGSGTIQRRHRA